MGKLYKQLLELGKEAIADIERPFKVRKEQKNLEMEIIKLEQQLAKDDLTLTEQKSANPIDWNKLIDAIDSKELNERKLKQLKNLEQELFGE